MTFCFTEEKRGFARLLSPHQQHVGDTVTWRTRLAARKALAASSHSRLVVVVAVVVVVVVVVVVAARSASSVAFESIYNMDARADSVCFAMRLLLLTNSTWYPNTRSFTAYNTSRTLAAATIIADGAYYYCCSRASSSTGCGTAVAVVRPFIVCRGSRAPAQQHHQQRHRQSTAAAYGAVFLRTARCCVVYQVPYKKTFTGIRYY